MDLPRSRWRSLQCASILLFALGMNACGGGGGGGGGSDSPAAGNPPVSTPPPPVSTPPTTTPDPTTPPSQGDNVAPTVTVSVTVDQDIITVTATATDNVAVTEVLFLVDNGAIEGRFSESPSDGTYSWRIEANLLSAGGSHTVIARARDAAGNSADSAVATFTIGNAGDGTDTVPPTVSATESGNFGLIALAATASDNVGVDAVHFLIDGQLVGRATRLGNDGSFALVFDASGLSDGNHTLVARARDRRFNQADSEPVSFGMDSRAGIRETEPNNTVDTANALTADVRLLTGLVEIDEVGGFPIPRDDLYKVNLAVGASLRIDMLCADPRFLLLRLEDASGTVLVPDNRDAAAKTIVYNNVDMPRDVYIRVSSTAARLGELAKYNLSLSYP